MPLAANYTFTTPCANVAGPIDIWVSTGSNGIYEQLGRSINGVQVADNPFIVPVHSDTNGGEQGPPVDYQFLGKQGFLSCEMAQYNESIMDKVRARIPVNSLNSGNAAVTFSAGMLLGCAGAFFRVILYSPNWTRRYLGCIPIEPMQFNVGVIHSRHSIAFICNAVNGVVYDSTVAAVE